MGKIADKSRSRATEREKKSQWNRRQTFDHSRAIQNKNRTMKQQSRAPLKFAWKRVKVKKKRKYNGNIRDINNRYTFANSFIAFALSKLPMKISLEAHPASLASIVSHTFSTPLCKMPWINTQLARSSFFTKEKNRENQRTATPTSLSTIFRKPNYPKIPNRVYKNLSMEIFIVHIQNGDPNQRLPWLLFRYPNSFRPKNAPWRSKQMQIKISQRFISNLNFLWKRSLDVK